MKNPQVNIQKKLIEFSISHTQYMNISSDRLFSLLGLVFYSAICNIFFLGTKQSSPRTIGDGQFLITVHSWLLQVQDSKVTTCRKSRNSQDA
jgi:hypothetical protein